jgi:hypothetical protein
VKRPGCVQLLQLLPLPDMIVLVCSRLMVMLRCCVWLQETERVWSNPPYNFDHLGMALVSLFITVTLNGYAGTAALLLAGCQHALPWRSRGFAARHI